MSAVEHFDPSDGRDLTVRDDHGRYVVPDQQLEAHAHLMQSQLRVAGSVEHVEQAQAELDAVLVEQARRGEDSSDQGSGQAGEGDAGVALGGRRRRRRGAASDA